MTLTPGSRSSLRELSLSGLGGLGALPPIEPSAVKVFILSVMMMAGMVMRKSFGAGVPIVTALSRFFVVIRISMKISMLMFSVGVSVLCRLDNWRLVSLFKAV